MREAVFTDGAAVVGPYSPAIVSDGHVFCSGQTPVDPATGKLVVGDVAVQTKRCLDNLFAVLAAAGLTPDDVVKVNVYLTHMHDFDAMNGAYTAAFTSPYPARTTVGVAALPLGAQVEIELVARRR